MIVVFFGFLLLAALVAVTIDRLNVAHETMAAGELDLPAYVLAVLVRRLPEERRDWGAAMVAELTQIGPAGARWRFTAGAARVALFPPPARPLLPASVAGAGVLTTTVAALTVHAYVPTAQAFVIATGLLLSGYLAVRVTRPARVGWLGVAVGSTILLGVAGCVGIIMYAVVTYPYAGEDPSRLFNLLLTIIVVGYVMLGMRVWRGDPGMLRWAVVAVLAGAIVVAADSFGTNGLSGISFLADDAAVLVVATVAANRTGEWRAGGRVGLWAGLLGALVLFGFGMVGTLTAHRSAVDVSDDLGGLIIMLLWFPVGAVAVGMLGGALGRAARIR